MATLHQENRVTAQQEESAATLHVLFSHGFRPFFLFAGIYAVISMAAWLLWLWLHANNAVVTSPTIAVAPHLWHGHEMLFGFGGAVISGFLLTAVPNWTGTRALSGSRLAFLASAWLLGRFAVWFSAIMPPLAVAAVDLSHLILLAGFVISALLKKPGPRHLPFVGVLLLLICANAAVHAEWVGWTEDTASWGLTFAIYLFTTMIVVIGGRVVPAFTRNALVKRGCSQNLPRSLGWLDGASIVSAASIPAAHLLTADAHVLGALAAITCMLNTARLLLWRGWSSVRQPIVWSLHLGYLFVVLGFAALALSGAGWLRPIAAQHVLAAGAVGCMTLAIMTRASLGHTGRPLKVNATTALAYLLVALSALVRALAPDALHISYFTAMYAAAGLWIAGFALFCITFVPILLSPSEEPDARD